MSASWLTRTLAPLLRTLAEETLGDDFDLRGFHDRVVGMGSITLPMLEESIEVWIAEQQAGG